jgi:hypothetical protein
MMVQIVARTFGVSIEVPCQRSIQAVHAGSAVNVGSVVVAGAHRRIAIPQRGDHALQRVQHRPLVPVGGRMRTQRGERHGVQIVEPGSAVQQQGLAEHAPQPVRDAQAVTVSPPVEHLAGPPSDSSTAGSPKIKQAK